jgi:hypothetical protein
VVGREHPGERPRGDEELEAVPGDALVVGILGGAVRRVDLGERGADRAGDPRPQAVRADDPAGVELDRGAGAIMAGHPHHPADPIPPHAGHGDAGAHLGAGAFRGGDQDGVQHVAARRHDQVDSWLLLDHPAHGLATGMEGDLPDGRGAAVQDLVEQAPAAELDDAAAGDRVGRHRVARERRLVNHRHVVSEAGQQHGGGRSGDPCADDDHVVTASVRGLHGWLAPVKSVTLQVGR